jgi:DNA-binding LacI/PurR family transcriptional regulator
MIQSDEFVSSSTAGRRHRPLYQSIVDDVVQKIRSGQYVAGEQIVSVADMCAHYDVSIATAHRSMSELAQMGAIKTIPRKGAFVVGVPAPPAVDEAAAVSRIVLVESVVQRRRVASSARKPANFSSPAVDAIVRACRHEQLQIDFQYIPPDPSAPARVFFSPRSGDAIIAMGAQVSVTLVSHLTTPNVPSVMIDAALPSAHCVLTDNYDGMRQVVEHLSEHGHRRVLLASCFATRIANCTNENERRDALLLHARSAGMQAAVVDSGDWDELFAALDGDLSPTAVVFTRDIGAVEFIKLARARGYDVPRDVSVVGFDDWASDPQIMAELTTVRVHVEQMGQEAMDLVLNPPAQRSALFQWRRVQPTLMPRATVARLVS